MEVTKLPIPKVGRSTFSMHHSTDVFPRTLVQITGQDLVSHAGVKPLASFMDALGIKSLGENHLGQFVPDGARHRPGAMIASLMAMLAAGGEHVSDLDMLRTSPKVFGTIPSNATISRFFDHVAGNREVFAHGLATMASQMRRRVWATLGGLGPGRVGHLDPVELGLFSWWVVDDRVRAFR